MARIRSLHPSFWTDEKVVQCQPLARLFFQGLSNEADDNGVFEWKPLTLKMRILPADNVDAAALLAEIESAGCILRFEQDGKVYGVVREFLKNQRPKKPTRVHPFPREAELFANGGEPVRNQRGTGSENSPQMEKEKEKEKEKKEEKKEEKNNTLSENPEPSELAETGPAASRRGGGKDYAFQARNIRLTRSDFDQWQQAFSNLNLEAELLSLDRWAGEQGKGWFHAVSSALAKRNREEGVRLERVRTEVAAHAAGGSPHVHTGYGDSRL